ncbi:MAG TPA: zinc metallopeptidase [Chitinophagales bacterium]|nr:zinc metallopeptidase [Chitinophagales bacterium]HMV02348.1 zinc metallopeptidase [Chitinophagales bacterium]HMW94306.1 zinc metallopeptidase [Chitinophagales bacterium]HMY43504.1 zinc metallopeptidase [Chitinophagales bacterium]HMZ68871.1 zinc metallopeptidase [Chitinophagales bacterium]
MNSGMLYILMFVIMGVSWWVSYRLKSKFKKYSEIPIGLTGKEVAEMMLQQYGITDVTVTSVPGALTDHYNPLNKTVNLSDWVYAQSNVAAAAVAAHECGHAVQHATAYNWLTMRSKMVPMLEISSKYMQWIILAGLGVLAVTNNPYVLVVGVALFALTTLFSFITLPVEFDASARAIHWIDQANIMRADQLDGAKDALKWAAMTYVVAALSSLVTLLYYISLILRRRD